ncbi:CGNR zinc finger domain-containing protein [Bradyrhizobium sp. 2TAF24]|uniref:CGNR zinc finger domain-containing protein n=1 Tax=Bradyrhizobium sp. 2TAF24 TaxID=3233011 RepID=UPI003F8E1944
MTASASLDFEQLRQQVLRLQIPADHPVLEFLNTVSQVNGQPLELWRSDVDVAGWLVGQGWHDAATVAAADCTGLVTAARSLREVVRALVVRRKQGAAIDAAELNVLLAHAASHLELVADGGEIRLLRRRSVRTPADLLAPVAEAAAELLATGDFDLIRKCEDPTCSLWFYDRTKSHRRRWCSMAACGNRHKVAAFRQRRKG